MEAGAGNHRSRNIMRIRNLTRTGIILALGTERLYLEPTRKPAIVKWVQNTIGMRHIELISRILIPEKVLIFSYIPFNLTVYQNCECRQRCEGEECGESKERCFFHSD